jgi:cytoskeletal protein CcmA (bactofilin family)
MTTVVAAGSRVQGEISGGTDVVIHGQVEGQLILGNNVVVGDSGEVRGQIEARQVQVGGKVHGDIRASERIEVLQSGRIEGDVIAPRVAINAGAFFKGKVEMTSGATEPEAAPEPEGRPEPKPEPKPDARPEQQQLREGAANTAGPAPSAAVES